MARPSPSPATRRAKAVPRTAAWNWSSSKRTPLYTERPHLRVRPLCFHGREVTGAARGRLPSDRPESESGGKLLMGLGARRHADTVAAAMFRRIEAGVRAADGLFVGLRAVILADADADGDRDRLCVDGELRLLDFQAQLFGDMLSLFEGAALEYDEKFLPAPADGDIRRPQPFLKRDRDLAQDAIAADVPEPVVDRFEVIDIDQQDGNRARVAPVFGKGLVDQDAEGLAVEQAGELVGGGHVLDALLVPCKRDMGQEKLQQRNAQTYREIEVEGLTDVGQRGIHAFFHEQIPLEFGDIVHIEQVQAVAVPELIGTGFLTQDAVDNVAQDQSRTQIGFLTFGLVAEQDGLAVRIHEIDGALEALLVIRDEVAHGIHSEPAAGGAEKAAVEVEDTIVDEDGQCIPVGQVGVDIDLVGFRHGART